MDLSGLEAESWRQAALEEGWGLLSLDLPGNGAAKELDLDGQPDLVLAASQALRQQDARLPQLLVARVITSYSIHYTKLYETQGPGALCRRYPANCAAGGARHPLPPGPAGTVP